MSELLDVVDDEDTVIGQETRENCHKNNLTHRSVMFFIFDMDDNILVNKRSQNKDFFGGRWSIVLGGHLVAGQTYEEAAIREAFEETGIKDKPFKMGYFQKRLPQENENVTVYGFKTAQIPKLLADEIEFGEFITWNEALNKMETEDFMPETDDLIEVFEKYFIEDGA